AALEKVRVADGWLQGAVGPRSGVAVFKGIPYAEPPVGALRWRPPQPVKPWTGVRSATAFGPEAMQDESRDEGSPTLASDGPHPTSEDCLYLNVWTPAQSAQDRLPVMVWIHGGGFGWGGGGRAAYDGEALGRKGVVVVTLNYRLNVFGFFATPELRREDPHS